MVWAVAGAFVGLLIVAIYDPHGEITDLASVSAFAGALAGFGLNRAFRS